MTYSYLIVTSNGTLRDTLPTVAVTNTVLVPVSRGDGSLLPPPQPAKPAVATLAANSKGAALRLAQPGRITKLPKKTRNSNEDTPAACVTSDGPMTRVALVLPSAVRLEVG